MALQIPVKLDGVHNLFVDDGAGWAVATFVGVLRLRKEAYVVALARDQQGDFRVDLQVLASLCRRVRLRWAERKKRPTPQTRKLCQTYLLVMITMK